VFLWLAVTSGMWLVADVNPGAKDRLDGLGPKTRDRYYPRHELANTEQLRLWPECWRLGRPDAERYALWDKLRRHPPHEASIGWEELGEVAEFLRTAPREDGGVGVRHREVVAWFDSPHAVYLLLDIDPAFRYMHVHTAIAISVGEDVTGMSGRRDVMLELRAKEPPGRYKYIISDLEWVALAAGDDPQLRAAMLGPARAPDDLLPAFAPYPHEFPFNQPTVFRSRNGTGRYIVHRVLVLGDGMHWWLVRNGAALFLGCGAKNP
jgi:hypothetical protein